MAGEVMNKKGITLIEVLVVIAIMAILAAIAIPNYNKWQRQYSIEEDTKEIYGIIQKERMKAFTQKKPVTISVSGKVLTVSGVDNSTINLKNTFSGGPINIDTRGTLNNNSIYDNSTSQGLSPQYDCVVVKGVRVSLGKFDGSDCNAK